MTSWTQRGKGKVRVVRNPTQQDIENAAKLAVKWSADE
jgi:hypothetical protein